MRCTLLVLLAALLAPGCVERKCFKEADCEPPRVCSAEGRCVYECSADADCVETSTCVAHRCKPRAKPDLACPSEMVAVRNAFCIDRYEASRRDATATSGGVDETAARSAPGVMPWFPADADPARAACRAAGKRLCREDEWTAACHGPGGAAYGYGEAYSATTCNGIDTFCRCGSGACSALSSCPSPHCWDTCGAAFHVTPTGSFPDCHDEWGAFDLNGNVWELVDLADGRVAPRGGAYNCSDSELLHRCDYKTDFTPPARGFRCCSDGLEAADAGTPVPPDAASPGQDAAAPDVGTEPDAADPGDGGCIEDPVDAAEPAGEDASAAGPDASGPGPDASVEVDAGGATDAGAACPPDMVDQGSCCIDLYEASRQDATDLSQGASPVAASRAGVQPWWPVTTVEARAACEAAGKRLCQSQEWGAACAGPSGRVYAYGNVYDPVVCNGIDAFCNCGSPYCQGAAQCPYAHCYGSKDPGGAGPCGASFHVVVTGAFPLCRAASGAHDLNGNLWEVVDSSDGLIHARGGAYNCGDSELLHRCDTDETWNPPARGFRCCKDRP